MKLDTRINLVCVLSNGARVTRSGSTELEAGTVELEVSNLPITLDESSIRVSGRGAAARLLGVDVRHQYYEQPVEERRQELENKLEEYQTQHRSLELQGSLLDAQQTYLLEMLKSGAEQLPRGLAFGRSSVETGQQLLISNGAALEEINRNRLELEKKLKDSTILIRQTNEQLLALGEHEGREDFVAAILMQVNAPGTVEIDLTYLVPEASWSPLYDIRLLGDNEPEVEVTYLSQVSQSSGEAWDDVELLLSTAREHSLTEIPELSPWYIREARPMPFDRAIPRPRLAMKVAEAPAAMDLGAGLVEESMELPELSVSTAEIISGGPAVTYRAAQRVSVPADGSTKKTTVSVLSFKPEMDYMVTPNLDEAAYRRAKVTNTSDYQLLPGEANLFWGDEFLGKTSLKNTAPGEQFELSLGVEERIKVKRKLNQRVVDKVMLRDIRKLRYGYEITLQNLLASSSTVIIREQIPVSKHEKITVQLDETSPTVTSQSEMGLLEWKVTMGAQTTQVVSYAFTVQHPREMQIIGLPQ